MSKKTALYDHHVALGAKMVDFAGYNLPIQYTGIKDEHEAVRKSVGIFDVSHMGEIIVKGDKALDLLQYLSSNDVSRLHVGKIQYGYFPNETGGIIDDFLTYKLDDQKYLLVVNASNKEKCLDWIHKNNTDFGAEIEDISESLSLFAVQGPDAANAINSLTEFDLPNMEYYTFVEGDFAGAKDAVISATGYTGAGGFEIYVKNEDAVKVWEAIMESGKEYDIKPAGLGARDTLRLEMGFCLYGNDIDEKTSPLEAGLGWVTKFTKDFVNSESLKAEKETGLKNRLVGFELIDRGVPRKDYPILNADGEEIGVVTSGTQSPSLNKAIGMGYVRTEFSKPETEIFIQVRNKNIKAVIKKPPFIR